MNQPGRQIFISTGSFGNQSVADILELCDTAGLRNLELSSGARYQDEMYALLKSALLTAKQNFLIHNYFPPPLEPFVLNLASNNEKILALSHRHCRKAIDLAAELHAPFYSVHSGFCVHAEPEHLGQAITQQDRFPKKMANDIFVDSLKRLSEYSAVKGVDLLIENNVVAPFNLIDGKNELLLGVTADELLGILCSVDRDNVGLLLDVAHLKVSANALEFCPENFIRDLADTIKAVHLSDNNGQKDTNDQVTENSWFWEPLLKYISPEVVWILEAYNLSLTSIKEQVSLIISMDNQNLNNV
ncbi:sugar phosphate isomerase/epimerase [bacterium]|nr:sugar phosphate isomerase/epimerase [bacterium]